MSDIHPNVPALLSSVFTDTRIDLHPLTVANNWGKLGTWDFHVNRDPQVLLRELRSLQQK